MSRSHLQPLKSFLLEICVKSLHECCFNNTIYLNRYVQNSINSEISQEIISYDMKTNEYSVIQDGEFFNLLCRMGKFIYYYENRFVEQLDSGEVKYSTDYYRYDILSKTTNLLEEDSVEPRIHSLLTSDGFIYGLNKDGTWSLTGNPIAQSMVNCL